VEDTDRRYRHWEGSVVINLFHTSARGHTSQLTTYQLHQPLLRLVVLGRQAGIELVSQPLLLGLVRLVLQPLEDLVASSQSRAADIKHNMSPVLTSSSCGAAIEAVVVVELEAWR
jgi:hypothetical protein